VKALSSAFTALGAPGRAAEARGPGVVMTLG
jgi:hypothetical protein